MRLSSFPPHPLNPSQTFPRLNATSRWHANYAVRTVRIADVKHTGETAPDGFFVVERTGDVSQALTLHFVLAGSAENNVDYTGATATGSLTFGAGSRTAQLDITPTDDEDSESAVFVSHVTHAQEGGAAGSITITAIGPGDGNTDPNGYTVWYRPSGVPGLDYETTATLDANGYGSFSFAEGPVTFSFDITAIDDELLLGTRSVSLTILPGSPYLDPGVMLVPNYSLTPPTSGTAKLFDNDATLDLVVGGANEELEDSSGVFLGLDDQFDPRAHELIPGDHPAVLAGSLAISTGGDPEDGSASPTTGELAWTIPSGVNVYWFRKGHWLPVTAEDAPQIMPDEPLYLQATATGSGELRASITPAYGTEYVDSAVLNVVSIDADVDSDNENGLERSDAEDAIEEDDPGVYVTVDPESAEFTPLKVEIGGIPTSGFMGADQELIVEFDADKLELWLDEVLVISGEPIAIPLTANYVFEFQVKGLAGLAAQPVASTLIEATIRIFTETAVLFQKADEVKVAVEPKIVKVEYIPFAAIDKSVGALALAEEQEKYGELGAADSNPNGNPTDNGDPNTLPDQSEFTANRALRQPAFMGGRRFFPDATIVGATSKLAESVQAALGKNVIRVRATVTGMKLDEPVWFIPIDVDDPSDRNYPNAPRTYKNHIDPNGDKGNDNRGRLAFNAWDPVASVRGAAADKSVEGAGRLRAVNALNAIGAFGGDGKALKALVKYKTNALGQTVDNDDMPTDDDAKKVLVAEVDLATTYAPGDNFRVVAFAPKPTVADADSKKALEEDLMRLIAIPTNGSVAVANGLSQGDATRAANAMKRIGVTEQLAVWRYLNIEDDNSAPLRKYLTPATTNRQQNRFADAFLEPKYLTLFAAPTPLPAAAIVVHPVGGGISTAGDTAIATARDSVHVETSKFWVVYIANTLSVLNQGIPVAATRPFTAPIPAFWNPPTRGFLDGYTTNKASKQPFQASLVFSSDITGVTNPATIFAAADRPEVQEKVAVHEIAHQILAPGGPGSDNDGHRGNLQDQDNLFAWVTAHPLETYPAEGTAEQKAQWEKDRDVWWQRVYTGVGRTHGGLENVNMMNAAAVRVQAGNIANSMDVYYLHPQDVDAIRRKVNSP